MTKWPLHKRTAKKAADHAKLQLLVDEVHRDESEAQGITGHSTHEPATENKPKITRGNSQGSPFLAFFTRSLSLPLLYVPKAASGFVAARCSTKLRIDFGWPMFLDEPGTH